MCVRGIDFATVFTIFDSDLELFWRCGIFFIYLYSSLVMHRISEQKYFLQ